jgi:2-iminobutanoate/2-iminopropanoate deaminase
VTMSGPVGPYSPTKRAGELFVCSGQLGMLSGPSGPQIVEGGIAPQVLQALINVGALLESEGLGWSDVLKTTVFLADIADYASFNDVYVQVLGEARPARSVVAVAGLPLGALVEVEAWAWAGPTEQ